MAALRRHVRSFTVLATVVALVLSTGGAADLENELQETRDDLAEARAEREQAEQDVEAAYADLQDIDRRLGALNRDLSALETQLAEAQAIADEARAQSEAARRRLELETQALARAREDQAAREDDLEDRAVAAYKYGSISVADVVLGADDITEFAHTMYQVRAVMDTDRVMVEEIQAVTRDLVETRSEVDRLRERMQAQELAANDALNRVEEAAQQHRRLTEQVQSEVDNRRRILADLEANEARWRAMEAELEAESKRIAEEIARSRWRAGMPVGDLLWPTNGRVTSGYGWRTHPIYGTRRMHTGIDISGSMGQSIVAASEGLVLSAGWRGGYGLTVVIDHGGGMATLYAHQSALNVREGQVVSEGQRIGQVGSTGNSTGPHLHFEVRINGEPRDPMDWYR